MSSLSPTAGVRAELLDQLSGVGRILLFERALVWGARGLLIGVVGSLAVVGWTWMHVSLSTALLPLVIGVPLLCTVLGAAVAPVRRSDTVHLARRVDRAAGLQERILTAIELSQQAGESWLAMAQMRDAVEHLRRLDLLDVFPLRVPLRELLGTAALVGVAALLTLLPYPWATHARATSASIAAAREEAQHVDKVAETIQPGSSSELDQLRALLLGSAQAIDAGSDQPDQALADLADLETQIQQMSASDNSLAAALAAVANTLGGNSTTSGLAAAINSGDMHQVARAARDLSQKLATLDPAQRQEVAQLLAQAAQQAQQSSPAAARALGQAANGLQSRTDGVSNGDGSSASTADAQQALSDLATSADAASARQSAASQVAASQQALSQALANDTGASTGSTRGSGSTVNGSQPGSDQTGTGTPGQSLSSSNDGSANDTQAGDGANSPGSGTSGSSPDGSGDQSGGPGSGTGADPSGLSGAPESPSGATLQGQQVPNQGGFSPDQSSTNPYLQPAPNGSAQTPDQQVNPTYQRQDAQGGDNGTVPLGLRDLVKDYFSSINQK